MENKSVSSSTCAVSVIISLYNYEKYIGECLDSILAQTFQDFEVIVVDDCSTDNSFEVAASYKPKFNGRLNLVQTEKNTGGGGEPRNIGLGLASGEYVFFMDADDALTKTGLEEMYSLAKQFNADTVYCEKYFMSEGVGEDFLKNIYKAKTRMQRPPFVDEPTLESRFLDKRINKAVKNNYWITPWLKLVQRELLLENNIKFSSLIGSNDFNWSFKLLFCSKVFLRVPNACYIRRVHDESTSFRERTQSEHVHKNMDRTIRSLKEMDNFMLGLSFFRTNPDYRYKVLDYFIEMDFNAAFLKCKNLTKYQWYAIFREHFSDYLGDNDVLVSCLAARLQGQRKHWEELNKRIAEENEKKVAELNNKVQLLEKANCGLRSHAISVIIPLYNAEKYLGECLDSLLAQTFQDFELILVDDCSTDSSCEIVESYMPKFGGRLKLYHMAENTGSGALPRNKGLALSTGEYIYNMDNDDLLTKTALEELYTLAKGYDADVVYCEKYYRPEPDLNHLKVQVMQKGALVTAPTLEPENLAARVQNILDDRYWVVPWSKLIRRSLLVEHDINFPGLKISDDNIWNQGLLFYAKKYLRVPNTVYIYRFNSQSIMRVKKTPQQTIHFWLNPVILGLKCLDKLMSGHEFFKSNPSCRYALLKKFIGVRFNFILEAIKELPEADVYETIKEEFGKYFAGNDILVSCLCTYIAELNETSTDLKKKLELAAEVAEENQKRIAEQDAEIKRLRAKLDSMASILNQPTCAVSVIVPLYNAAEYVGECLESLLIQSFQDFEVIVVDDCSTDNSVEVVESYAPKFNGRLRVTKTEKNSGGGGYVPRNVGFKLANGKYVYFADADDFLLGSALETFYTLAEEHNADVVYTAAHYDSRKPNDVFVTRDGTSKDLESKGAEDEITLIVDEPDKILDGLIFDKGFTTPWAHFVRREFLLQNRITFPEIRKAGDYLWVMDVYCHAKRFLRLPTPLYFYKRYNVNSVSQSLSANNFSNWILSFADFEKALGELTNKNDILRENPSYSQAAATRYFEWCLKRTVNARKQLNNKEIYDILYHEFIKTGGSFDFMLPFFFSTIDAAKKAREDHLRIIDNLKKKLPR